MCGVPGGGEALGFDASFRQRMDVLACSRCGRRLTLITLIADPAVIVRFLVYLGLPTNIPEVPPLPSSSMRLRLRSSALRRTRLPQPVPRQTCASASGITLDRSLPNGHSRPDVSGRAVILL